jgi:MFS family permease
MARFAIDLTPLRTNRNLRNIFISGVVTRFGSALTLVALPFQIKELTNSYIAVGAMGAIEILPLIIFALWGGVLADSVDRKKMVWRCEAGALICSTILLFNSFLSHPHLFVLYVVAAGFSAMDGLQGPSYGAIIPRLVSHEDLPAAMALMSLRWQFSAIIGPALAGVIIATSGVKAAFAIDIASYLISLLFILKISTVPPLKEATTKSIKSMFGGLQYAASRKDLLGTYFIDLIAMFFAMPNALFPFWADHIHARWALGFFYSAGILGSIVITATSGWMKHFNRHGWAITIAAMGWGICIVIAGITDSLWMVLLFLALAGASDQVSALCRNTLWNQTIDDEFRGRLAGLELLSYSVGPLAGQLRAGTTAAITSLRTSVISGGLLCIGLVGFAASKLPDFRNFDLATNPYAIEQREKKKHRESFDDPEKGDK